MSEYTDQAAAIAAILATVPDVGRIHTRPRIGDYREHYLYEANGRPEIRAWEIGLDEVGIEAERIQQNRIHRRRFWMLKGYISADDKAATYDTINDLALAIQIAIDADLTLGDTALHHGDVSVDEPTPAFVGGEAMCWEVSIRFEALTVVPT